MARPVDKPGHPHKPHNPHFPPESPPPVVDSLILDWTFLADFADNSDAVAELCGSPVSVDFATQLISRSYTAYFNIKGPFGDIAPGVIISGEPVLTNANKTFDPWTYNAVRFKTSEVIGSNLALAWVEGQVGSKQCVAAPIDPGTIVIGEILGLYSLEFSDLYSVTVDCIGITAEFDGSSWVVDQVQVSAAAQGMSVTAIMKRV